MQILTSFYGMKTKENKQTQKYYQQQREKAITYLGEKYLLANPVKKETK